MGCWVVVVDPGERRERNHHPIPTGIAGVFIGKRPPPNWVRSSPAGALCRIKIQRVRTALAQRPLGFILHGRERLHSEPIVVGVPRHARLPEEKLDVRDGFAVKGAVQNDNLFVKPGFIDVAIAVGVLDDVEVHRNLKVTDPTS